MQTIKGEPESMATGANNFYVEQAQCAMCNELTLRIGVPEIDAMRGKEPVLCGFCLVEVSRSATENAKRRRGQ